MRSQAILALEDGSVFFGKSIGVNGRASGEVVFNTAMTGYQEIITDPSYSNQIINFTCPHIGNVGVNQADMESNHIQAAALVIRSYSETVSNWRAEESLKDWLVRNNVVAISDVDTRAITQILRDKGALKGVVIAGEDITADAAVVLAKASAGISGINLVEKVTTKVPYVFNEHSYEFKSEKSAAKPYNVVAIDYGAKKNILRLLVDQNVHLTVVPAHYSIDEILSLKPDGVFLSNGPGDPRPCHEAIKTVQGLLAKNIPIFGICFGHQLLALASGAQITKMKFGHHGANHPVENLQTKVVHITSQNHGFCLAEDNLPSNLIVTYRSLFDDSIQGIARTDKLAFSFQGHPEASPGPHDILPLFNEFIELMQKKSVNDCAAANARIVEEV